MGGGHASGSSSHSRAGRSSRRPLEGGARFAGSPPMPRPQGPGAALRRQVLRRSSVRDSTAAGSAPRILRLLEAQGSATFFMPAVSALCIRTSRAAPSSNGHELWNPQLDPRVRSTLPYEAERNLAFRAREVLARLSGPAGRDAHRLSGFQPLDARDHSRDGTRLRQLAHGRQTPGNCSKTASRPGSWDPVEWIRDDAVYFNMDRMSALRPYTGPDAVFEIFAQSSKARIRTGASSSSTMHPHVGHRSRIWILEESSARARLDGLVRDPRRGRPLLRHERRAAG